MRDEAISTMEDSAARDDNGVYKITDVRIGGVSMALAERSELSARIARSGGRVEGLLAMLRQEAPGFGTSAAAGGE